MVGKERLGWGGTQARRTWVQERTARDIDSEGGAANGFCGYGREGGTERI